MAEDRVTTRELIEVVVLAFSRSPAKKALGADALRMVLNGAYGGLVPGGRLSLQVVWGLIANMPGLVQDDTTPAFCLLKTWEPKLGVGVDLPDYLRSLSFTECAKRAAVIPLREADLKQLLAPAATPAAGQTAAPAAATPASGGGEGEKPRRRRERGELTPEQKKKRLYLAIGAGVIAAAAFTFAGITLISNTGGPHYSSGARDLSPIPVKNAKRLGHEVIGTLSDDAWFALPESERKAQLITALAANDVESVVLLDGDRRVRASAQRRGSGDIVVKFTAP